jgi:hypothetical protein
VNGLDCQPGKTELMAVCHDGVEPLETVQPTGGKVQNVSSFKYLGCLLDTSAIWEAEMNARISRVLY